MSNIKDLLKQALTGTLTCGDCGSLLEPDAKRCGDCGWDNPLVLGGYI